MSVIDSIFAADSPQDQSTTLATVTSTAALTFGTGAIIAVNASGDMCIKFGNSGMTAATATNFRIPAGVVATYVLGDGADRIRLFNPGASTITYWIQVLSTN